MHPKHHMESFLIYEWIKKCSDNSPFVPQFFFHIFHVCELIVFLHESLQDVATANLLLHDEHS